MSLSLSENMAAPRGPLRRKSSPRLLSWMGHRTMLVSGLILGTVILLFCFVGGLVYPVSSVAIHGHHAFQAPGGAFPLGTDQIGRDELARLIQGGFTTMIVAIPAALLTFGIGLIYGLTAALTPSWVDKILMRVLDALLALPGLVVLIFFASLFAPSNSELILLLGLTSWPGLARLVRNEAIAQRGRDFVLATRQFGGGLWYVARVHLLRVMAPILVVNFTFLIGDSVLALSGLSFLGLGVKPPMTSWGGLLQTGLNLIALNPYWMIFPSAIMIFGSIVATNLIGQGILARLGEGR